MKIVAKEHYVAQTSAAIHQNQTVCICCAPTQDAIIAAALTKQHFKSTHSVIVSLMAPKPADITVWLGCKPEHFSRTTVVYESKAPLSETYKGINTCFDKVVRDFNLDAGKEQVVNAFKITLREAVRGDKISDPTGFVLNPDPIIVTLNQKALVYMNYRSALDFIYDKEEAFSLIPESELTKVDVDAYSQVFRKFRETTNLFSILTEKTSFLKTLGVGVAKQSVDLYHLPWFTTLIKTTRKEIYLELRPDGLYLKNIKCFKKLLYQFFNLKNVGLFGKVAYL